MAASGTDDLDVGTGHGAAAGTDPVVTMHVFKGRGPTDVRLRERAPFGWWPAVVLSLVSLLDRLEQSMLAGALPDIQREFGINDSQAGLIALATGIAGVVLFIPAGRIADRMNRKNGLALVVASWSVLSLGSGLAIGFMMLLAMRTLIGAAGQLNNPAGSSLLADFYPSASRTRVYGIERLVYFLGNPLGVILGGVIAGAFGWRWVFVGLVLPGIVIAVLCWFMREPYRGTSDRIDALLAERDGPAAQLVDPVSKPVVIDEVPDDVRDVSVWEDVRALFAVPTLRVTYIGLFVLFVGLGGLFFWMPTLFQRAFDLSDGAASGVTGMTGMVGVSLGAWLGVRFGTKHHGVRPGWRIQVASVGILIGTFGIGVLALAPSLPVAMLGFAIANLGFMMAIPNLTAAVADLSGSMRRGMAFSVMQLTIGLASAGGPQLIGLVSDLADAWDLMFLDSMITLQFALFGPMIPLGLAGLYLLRARRTYDEDAANAITTG